MHPPDPAGLQEAVTGLPGPRTAGISEPASRHAQARPTATTPDLLDRGAIIQVHPAPADTAEAAMAEAGREDILPEAEAVPADIAAVKPH